MLSVKTPPGAMIRKNVIYILKMNNFVEIQNDPWKTGRLQTLKETAHLKLICEIIIWNQSKHYTYFTFSLIEI